MQIVGRNWVYVLYLVTFSLQFNINLSIAFFCIKSVFLNFLMFKRYSFQRLYYIYTTTIKKKIVTYYNMSDVNVA